MKRILLWLILMRLSQSYPLLFGGRPTNRQSLSCNTGSGGTSIYRSSVQSKIQTDQITWQNGRRRDDLLLFASTDHTERSENDRPSKGRLPNPIKAFQQGAVKLWNARMRIVARFQTLSRRSKIIVIAYMLIVSFAFGGAVNNMYRMTSTPPPIEISYSSFLDIVEGHDINNANAPTVDRVRIGRDRIYFRLFKDQPNNNDNALALELPTTSGKTARRIVRQQFNHPYLAAYTRQIPDSTPKDLVDKLRIRDISFAAIPAPKPSTIALTVRSFMIGFYCLILLRLYRSISGASGGKGETPGKLAKVSDLPPSSFDDIQGIDDSKQEVMELVDSLRNPEKYAILGARAPTGLLLVGPPGTGKIFCFSNEQKYRSANTIM